MIIIAVMLCLWVEWTLTLNSLRAERAKANADVTRMSSEDVTVLSPKGTEIHENDRVFDESSSEFAWYCGDDECGNAVCIRVISDKSLYVYRANKELLTKVAE